MTAVLARSPARRSAISTDVWRLAWAAPIPIVAPFRARTIAFERTWQTERQAKRRSFSSSSVGRRFVTTWSRPRSRPTSSRLSTRSAAGDALEVEAGDPVVAHALGRVGRDGEDLEPGLGLEDPERGLAVGRGDDRLVRVGGDLAGGRPVHLAVDPDDPAERRDRVGLEGVAVGLDELVARGDPDRVGVLDDRDRRGGEVAGDPVGGVEVEVVVERRPLAPDLGRVGERPAAVGRLAVERGPLVGVLAVAQVVDLLEDDGEALRERRCSRSG